MVEFTDASLASQGKLIGFDESRQLIYNRGGFRILVKKTAKYELPTADGWTVLGAETPTTLFPRTLCHTSVFAWLAVQKFALGVPHYRLEQHLKNEAEPLDRGTMCRYMEELGNTLGAQQLMTNGGFTGSKYMRHSANGPDPSKNPVDNGVRGEAWWLQQRHLQRRRRTGDSMGSDVKSLVRKASGDSRSWTLQRRCPSNSHADSCFA